MAETIVSNPRGAEISERSRELVLPDDEATTLRVIAAPIRNPSGQREFGVSESEITATEPTPAERAERGSTRAPNDGASPARATLSASSELLSASPETTPPTPSSEAPASGVFPGDRSNRGTQAVATPTQTQTTPPERTNQRPSFWRRIALGRRGAAKNAEPTPAPTDAMIEPTVPTSTPTPTGLAARAKSIVAPKAPEPVADTRALETAIMEPMLQALVSVEAKLERSHGDLMGRSDAVEQRLTQLWDIEEQLGTLGELQESLLQVSEQQRRLESAIVGQTRTLRWLIGAVFLSLAAAAFVVAALQ